MKHSYQCLVYRQRPDMADAPIFCIFHAPASEILQWATVKRLENKEGGPQRRTSPSKVQSVKRFLALNNKNTIPTSVIITLDLSEDNIQRIDGSDADQNNYLGNVTIDDDTNPVPGLIIDGQHRVFGIDSFDPNMHLTVVGLLNADDTEKAFQFLVINNKASKVSTDHIRALALQFEETQLEERLKTARLSLHSNVGLVALVDSEEDSPFKGIIDWPLNPPENQIVMPAAIETSLSHIQNKKIKIFESEDILLEYFFTLWRTVKERWPGLWDDKSKLLEKVGIVCLTQYLTDALEAKWDMDQLDLSSPEDIKKAVDDLLMNQEEQFWKSEWSSASYDTKAGRALVVDALKQISRNKRAGDVWYDDISLVVI